MRPKVAALGRYELWRPFDAGSELGATRVPLSTQVRATGQLRGPQMLLRKAERSKEVANLDDLVLGEVPSTS